MAQTTQASKPANASGGRPAKVEAKTPDGRARANLQYTLDRANSFINDGTASFARRARAAARAGVPKEVVLKGFAAMEAALKDARSAIEQAYAEPTKAPAPASRVSLV